MMKWCNEYYGFFTLSSKENRDLGGVQPFILDMNETIYKANGGIEIWSKRP